MMLIMKDVHIYYIIKLLEQIKDYTIYFFFNMEFNLFFFKIETSIIKIVKNIQFIFNLDIFILSLASFSFTI